MIALIAQFISAIASPLVIAIPFCYVIILKTTGSSTLALTWSIVSLVFVSIVGAFVYYGVKKGFFTNLDVSDRRQRPKLFLFTGAVCFLYLLIVIFFNGPKIIFVGLATLFFGIILAEIINTKVKASMHLAIFVGFATAMGILYGGPSWILFLFTPIVAWSRLVLKRHTPREVVVGTIFGIAVVLIAYGIVIYL